MSNTGDEDVEQVAGDGEDGFEYWSILRGSRMGRMGRTMERPIFVRPIRAIVCPIPLPAFPST